MNPKTKAIIASPLILEGVNNNCIPASRANESLNKYVTFSKSHDMKIKNAIITPTLNGGRQVVERAEETQPTPNINAQVNVMYKQVRSKSENTSVFEIKPEITPAARRKTNVSNSVNPSTIIIFRKALSLVRPMNI